MRTTTTSPTAEDRLAEICTCWDDAGLMASTWHDDSGTERCDLCGRRSISPEPPVLRWVLTSIVCSCLAIWGVLSDTTAVSLNWILMAIAVLALAIVTARMFAPRR